MSNIYKQLLEGGGYTLPFLIHLYNADHTSNIYLVNDNQNIEYEENTYLASTFSYSPQTDGGSTLEIELVKHNEIIDLLENNYFFTAKIVGVINGNTIEKLSLNRYKFGEASWNGQSVSISFESDDRLAMTFPTLIFNSYNNRGNT